MSHEFQNSSEKYSSEVPQRTLRGFYEKEGLTTLRYGINTAVGIYHSLRLHAILRAIRDIRGKNVIDVGCGDGFIISILRDRFNYVVALDYAISYLHRNSNADDCILCSWDYAPFKARCIDIVVAFDVLEHLLDMDGGLKQLARCAKNYVVISIPLDGWHRRLAKLLKVDTKRYDKKIGHIHVYQYDVTKQKVLDNMADWKIIHEEFLYVTPNLLVKGIPIKFIENLNRILDRMKIHGSNWVIWVLQRIK